MAGNIAPVDMLTTWAFLHKENATETHEIPKTGISPRIWYTVIEQIPSEKVH